MKKQALNSNIWDSFKKNCENYNFLKIYYDIHNFKIIFAIFNILKKYFNDLHIFKNLQVFIIVKWLLNICKKFIKIVIF